MEVGWDDKEGEEAELVFYFLKKNNFPPSEDKKMKKQVSCKMVDGFSKLCSNYTQVRFWHVVVSEPGEDEFD